MTGDPLVTVLQDAVFTPAGMTATMLGGELTVLGYEADLAGAVVDPHVDDWAGSAGGEVSTAQDVDRFYGNLFAGGTSSRPRLVREMSAATGQSRSARPVRPRCG